MSIRLGARSVGRAVLATLALGGLTACSGAGYDSLLQPPAAGSTSTTSSQEASTSTPFEGGASNPGDDAPSGSEDSSGSDDASGIENADDAAATDVTSSPPGAEPASPCPACTGGTTCCANATSIQYGTCYSAALCLVLCCN
jgi:hypothetical protein